MSFSDLPDTLTPKDTLTPLTNSQKNQIQIPIKPWGRLQPCLSYLEPIDLVSNSIMLGRSEHCDIVIHKHKFVSNQCLNVSKRHFVIFKDIDAPTFITDLSKNGTFVNGILIGKGKKFVLQHNDVISIANKNLNVYLYTHAEITFTNYLPRALRAKYEPFKLLGRGAVGEVHLAYEKTTCKKYAIKKIIKGRSTDSNTHLLNHPTKIQTEINILKALSHPCIIKVREIVETDDEVFIVLQYMRGGELTSRIRSMQSEQQVKFIFYQIAMAVGYLHLQGITHRDLKPENVLLASDEAETLIKVTDFGLSKITEDNGCMQTICGTLNYIAPEVIDTRYKEYNRQCDVWSMGVILYYMLCKELPFKANDRPALIKIIMRGEYSMDGSNWAGVSREAKHLIKRMLTVNPQRRITVPQILEHPWIVMDVKLQYKVDKLIESNINEEKMFYSDSNDSSPSSEPPPKRFCCNVFVNKDDEDATK